VEAEADGIVVAVRNAVRQTRNAYQTWNLQAGAVVLAERRVESSDLNLENGKASTRDVLDAEEDLRQALNSRSAALVDYSLSRLELYLDVEALRVDEDGIGLDPESLAKLGAGQEADVEVVEQPEGGSAPVPDDSEAPAEQGSH
jgi:hypothetical protein